MAAAAEDEDNAVDVQRRVNPPMMINEKLRLFLSNAYLGPLYENGTVSERIGAYLYFLDPESPFYKVTTSGVLMTLLSIYREANDIEWEDTNGQVTVGSRPDNDIKAYFDHDYNRAAQKELEHQQTHNEVVGQIRRIRPNGTPFPPGARFRRPFYIPTKFGQPTMLSIVRGNEERYTDLEEEEIEEFYRMDSRLKEALSESKKKMANHPEVIDGSHPLPDAIWSAGIKPARR